MPSLTIRQSADDATLVQAAREGSRAAAEELFERHWPSAWRTAYAVLGERAGAEDAAQLAVERAIRSLHGFDTTRPFAPWFSRIAANQALNMLRARRRETQLPDDLVLNGPYQEVGERDRMVRAVAALPEDRRLVVALRYWADLDPPEIAEALDLPIGTVSSRLSRALRELRTSLEEVSR